MYDLTNEGAEGLKGEDLSQEGLAPARRIYSTPREQGSSFERRVQFALENHPIYSQIYKKIYSYADWAEEQGFVRVDAGIDLVAITDDKVPQMHAIQCKDYSHNHIFSKKDLESFFQAAGDLVFSQKIFVTTGVQKTKNLETNLKTHRNFSWLVITDLEAEITVSPDFWSEQESKAEIKLPPPKKQLRAHQIEAVKGAHEGFKDYDRGQWRMACGTGKTLTALRFAEEYAGPGKTVLLLVPSLALMSQTITEWYRDANERLVIIPVCSDKEVGKASAQQDYVSAYSLYELPIAASTDAARLQKHFANVKNPEKTLRVVLSTYNSLKVVAAAQGKPLREAYPALGEFDLIICDEAHRTTGQAFEIGDRLEQSFFTKIHDQNYIKGKKRLYMTATPRLYVEKERASKTRIFSMDDEEVFGPTFYELGFKEAVERGLLSDYKVHILGIPASIATSCGIIMDEENRAINVSQALKIIGSWKGLTRQESLFKGKEGEYEEPLRRAVMFCQVIDNSRGKSQDKIGSKQMASHFADLVNSYKKLCADFIAVEKAKHPGCINFDVNCEVRHVDGTMNALEKKQQLAWLRAPFSDNSCRILSNVRCLSEGVDVPALDAVIFLSPRSSYVDVIQAVGRVMRRSEGKKYGYIILPIVVSSELEHNEAALQAIIERDDKYQVIWQVLRAMRAHDERIAEQLQKGQRGLFMENLHFEMVRSLYEGQGLKKGPFATEQEAVAEPRSQEELFAEYKQQLWNDLQREKILAQAIYSVAINKVGDRRYWEDWAKDTASFVTQLIEHIKQQIAYNEALRAEFVHFLAVLHEQINDGISENEAIEMLAQHYVTKPIFDQLIDKEKFSRFNPIARALDHILRHFSLGPTEGRPKEGAAFTIDLKTYKQLQRFYSSIKTRAAGAETADQQQELIRELYDSFYRNAFPKMVERLGIVYTPVAGVDFVIKSIEYLLVKHFNSSFNNKDVHVLEPFAGTGTFITRLLQSGLIKKEALQHCYNNRIFVAEIVLLSYYLATLNIESSFASLHNKSYQPLPNIIWADSFELYEQEKMGPGQSKQFLWPLDESGFAENKRRAQRQIQAPINVIFGNPPYSSKQKNYGDHNQNRKYPYLDSRIRETYIKHSKDVKVNCYLYDAYIRALRWASDRIEQRGIIGFVIGSGFLNAKTLNGVRASLSKEFNYLYIINLRGNVRQHIFTKGKTSEGGNFFGKQCMTGNCLLFLVKDPSAHRQGRIFYYDIGDDLSTLQKNEKLQQLGSLAALERQEFWQEIKINEYNEWFAQRQPALVADYNEHILLVSENRKFAAPADKLVIFNTSGGQPRSGRFSWIANFSRQKLVCNMQFLIARYNEKLAYYKRYGTWMGAQHDFADIAKSDDSNIAWTCPLARKLAGRKRDDLLKFNEQQIILANAAPFSDSYFYYDQLLCDHIGSLAKMYPPELLGQEKAAENLLIVLPHRCPRQNFMPLMVNKIMTGDILHKARIFPLYIYHWDEIEQRYRRDCAINRAALRKFSQAIGHQVKAEDLFFYAYAVFSHRQYIAKYKNLLNRMAPRLPLVRDAADFFRLSAIGKEMGLLHADFAKAPLCSASKIFYHHKETSLAALKDLPPWQYKRDLSLSKMRFGKINGQKDKSIIHYNEVISITNIPARAYDYEFGNQSPIEWVMCRHAIRRDSKSGIINDPNDFAEEYHNNPAYVLELLLRAIYIGQKTEEWRDQMPDLAL